MRKTLSPENTHKDAQHAINTFHAHVVKEVEVAIKNHEWVIVGMAQNPVVKSARKHLDSKGMTYHYISYGSYLSDWKKRLAIKLWSGWPTFPQVFHQGILIGGFKDLKKYLP